MLFLNKIMNEIQKDLNNLNIRIEKIGLKKASFADDLNITHSYLSRVLSSEKNPSKRLMRDMEFVLKAYEDTKKIIKEFIA